MQKTKSVTSQTIATSKGQIEYAVNGHGPIVLGIHGSPGNYHQSLFVFQDIVNSEKFTLLAVSRPGYGRTPLSCGKSPAEQADALVALLDSLCVEKIAVVAISGGGPVAIQLALRHPNRVWALCLTAAATKSEKSKIPNSIKELSFLNFGIFVGINNVISKYFTNLFALFALNQIMR